jgi:hypothetical protein
MSQLTNKPTSMKRALPLLLLSTITITSINAQNDRFAYAITDVAKEGAGWNALRKLDLQTGEYSTILFNGTTEQAAFDAVSKKQLTLQADARYGTMLNTPFGTGVAAAAYDKRHNRLYFTPMFVDQLRYVDLKTMKVYYVADQAFTRLGNMHNDEGKIITRMVITPDGNGYAISNDGNTFVRFSTGKKPKIEQLGTLVDDPSNNGISIHNRCSSFGGDMISDDNGKLYILTARNHVFSVDVETKVAKHLGSINGLPNRFTVNGAVVNADGALLVSSAVDGDAYYTVNSKDWSASKYEAAKGVFRASDLANSNYLSTRTTTKEMTTIARPEERFAKLISVYPNPVTENRITLQFNKVPQGDYTIELMDVLGRSVLQRRISINIEEQVQALELPKNHSKGVYMVKVFDRENQSVFTQKVMVQ